MTNEPLTEYTPSQIAEMLERSDERDRYVRRITESWREGFLTGHAAGVEEGRRAVLAELEAEQRRICQHVKRISRQPDFDELQRRRYSEGGKAA